MGWLDSVSFSDLIGKTIVTTDFQMGDDRHKVTFITGDGCQYVMYHDQDCCEGVEIEEVIGDIADLQNTLVIDAREEEGEGPAGYDYADDSHTWTFYVIQTDKGAVTIRWLGQSNGYYSEGVNFELVPKLN